jgi:hypothetical protein
MALEAKFRLGRTWAERGQSAPEIERDTPNRQPIA